MENKQTAVEWLVEQIKSDQNQKALSASEWMQVIDQTKQMEREQTMDFAMKFMMQDRPIVSFYNEIYGEKLKGDDK